MPGKTSTATPKTFGELVQEVRGKHQTQEAFGKRIGRSQTEVARLEKDAYSTPPREVVERIAEVATEDFPKSARHEKQREFYARLVGALVDRLYGLSETASNTALLELEARDLSGLAEWEREVKATRLWIVTPAFQDNRNPDLLKAVAKRLDENTQVEFFVPEYELDLHGGWPRLVARLREELSRSKKDWQSRLMAHGLRDAELRWLTSSVVIAHMNKSGDQAIEGYLILDRDGSPSIGIRMSHDEVYRRFAALADWLRATGKEKKTVLASQIIDPLSHSVGQQ